MTLFEGKAKVVMAKDNHGYSVVIEVGDIAIFDARVGNDRRWFYQKAMHRSIGSYDTAAEAFEEAQREFNNSP